MPGSWRYSAPGTYSSSGKQVLSTAFAGQPPARSWQKRSTDSKHRQLYRAILNLFTSIHYTAIVKTIKDRAKKQQSFHIYVSPEIFLQAAKKKVTQQSQRAAEISVILKLCFGSCKILILCMQLRDCLHSRRSCYFVLGKTILEGLFRINKKIEVNKVFFHEQ